jgi:iron complex outermembrane receptor protein
MTMLRPRLMTGLLTVMLAGAGLEGSAHAAADQGNPDPAPQTSDQAPTSAQEAAAARVAAEQSTDIIVTATRREERLQDVPISITAIGGDQLERSGVTNTRELTQAVPNLNFARVNLHMQPTIRGVGTRNTSAGDESNIAVYVDGVYQPEMTGLLMELVGVERVEVLRGPQGTLFGRNSTGGLINVITRAPSHDAAAEFQVRYGRFNERSIQGYATAGLTSTLAFNVAGMIRDSDGYVTNLVTGESVETHAHILRARLLFEPRDNVHFTLTGTISEVDDPTIVNAQPFRGNTSGRSLANDPRTLVTTVPYTSAPTRELIARSAQETGSLEGVFELGAVNVETTVAYSRTRWSILTDADNTPFQTSFSGSPNGGDTSRSSYWSHELRLLSDTDGPFSWIAGSYLFAGTSCFCTLSITAGTIPSFINSTQRVESAAAFGEGTLSLGDFRLIAGARYTAESRNYRGSTVRLGVTTSSIYGAEANFGQLTYRGIVQYNVGSLGHVYASLSRGFKSGVFNGSSTTAATRSTEPEILDAYEIGFKADPFPGIRLNVSAFHYDYDNIQLSARDATTLSVILLNAARARINGLEAELTARIARGLNFRTYATYLDANYTDFPNAQVFTPILQNQTAIGGSATTPIGNAQTIADVSGSRMIRAPRFTFGASFDYTTVTSWGQLGLSGNVFHSSRQYWDFANRLFQPAYTLVNAQASWTSLNDRFRVSLWANNITDEVVFANMNTSQAGDYVAFDRPRSYGITLGLSL